MLKTANWGNNATSYEVIEREHDKSRANEYSLSVFGSKSRFIKKYAYVIDDYKQRVATKSNRLSIGNYDPEFHYFRVIAVHGDIPNSNGDYWEWGNMSDKKERELLRFDESNQRYVYESFVGRGNFKNHANDDVSKAVGIVLDAVPNHNGRFIECLLAVDGVKDPELVRAIDKGYTNSVSMGCLIAGERITMSDFTFKNIENIEVGDKVFTHLANDNKVLNLQQRRYSDYIHIFDVEGIDNLLTFTNEHPIFIAKKEDLQCDHHRLARDNYCLPHPLLGNLKKCNKRKYGGILSENYCEKMNNQSFKIDFERADKCKSGDYIAIPFDVSIEKPVDYEINAPLARIFGYYMSEGSPIRDKKGEICGISFSFGNNEQDKKYVKELKELFSIVSKANFNENVWDCRPDLIDVKVFDKDIANLFKKIGNEKSHYKSFDKSVMKWDNELQLQMIGSYINGDGTEYKNRTLCQSASNMMLNQLFYMLLRNGIISSVKKAKRNPRCHKVKGRIVKDGDIFELDIPAIYGKKLSKYSDKLIDKDVIPGLSRFIYKNYLMSPIKSISKILYDGYVYNFEVENDNSYCVENVAVHNCVVGHSICSVCGNSAKVESDFCNCVKFHKGHKINANGKEQLVYEINRDVNFIELSWVGVPADPSALLLEKVASKVQNGEEIDLNDNHIVNAVATWIYLYGEEHTRNLLGNLVDAVQDIKQL
jgi:hypothetical protein